MSSILFVSPYNFNKINGGTILFREFFKNLEPNRVGWFICSQSNVNNKIDYKFKFEEYFDELFFNNYYLNLLARKFPLLGNVFYFIRYNLISRFVSRKLIYVIKNKSIDKLWVYASHSTIPTLYFVLKKIKIKYHLSIQDDYRTHLPTHESQYLKNKFQFIIENAYSIDFISTSMENYYRKKYTINSKTTVFYISHKTKDLKLPIINKTIAKIGYAGNIWCGPSFVPLLKAIRELKYEFNIDIKLLIFAQNFPKKLFNEYLEFIEYKGFKSGNLLVKELQYCDLLYLPLTFDENQRVINLTSFPSKIITYLNSGIPILNHSPSDSSTNFFIKENKIGYSINSIEKNDFVNLLLNDNDNIRKLFSSNSSVVLEKFDENNMINSLKSLIFNNC